MDKRIQRGKCPFCGQRVTIGAANRIYKHNDASGRYCVKGHGFKMQPVQRKETNNNGVER